MRPLADRSADGHRVPAAKWRRACAGTMRVALGLPLYFVCLAAMAFASGVNALANEIETTVETNVAPGRPEPEDATDA